MIRKDKPTPKASYGMVIDLDRCNGCGACMVACAIENNVPPPNLKATPRTGLNWVRVFRVETSSRPAFVPVLCMQCGEETPCQSVCPQNAVEFDPATGVAMRIDLGGQTAPNGDGILLHGQTLYVVQNRLNQIAVINLSPDLTSGFVARVITDPAFRVPTTIARFGDALYAVNARFGTPPTPDTDYDVVRVDR